MSTVALGGHRIDPPGSEFVGFPFANVPMVQKRLKAVFRRRGVSTLVCLAACGADLAALKIAGTLGLRRRIVLPFPPERFRRTSVTDRPGNWGGLYDRIIAEAMAAGDLVVLQDLVARQR